MVNLHSANLLEREILSTLALAEMFPVRGREHFDISALPVILDVVDNYAVREITA